MFLKNEDLDLLKEVNNKLLLHNIDNTKLSGLLTRLENERLDNTDFAKNKIEYMRKNGFPYYARPKSVQENHYKKHIKEVIHYIELGEKNVAMRILERIIRENSYSIKQKQYFMTTLPQNVIDFYNAYDK